MTSHFEQLLGKQTSDYTRNWGSLGWTVSPSFGLVEIKTVWVVWHWCLRPIVHSGPGEDHQTYDYESHTDYAEGGLFVSGGQSELWHTEGQYMIPVVNEYGSPPDAMLSLIQVDISALSSRWLSWILDSVKGESSPLINKIVVGHYIWATSNVFTGGILCVWFCLRTTCGRT